MHNSELSNTQRSYNIFDFDLAISLLITVEGIDTYYSICMRYLIASFFECLPKIQNAYDVSIFFFSGVVPPLRRVYSIVRRCFWCQSCFAILIGNICLIEHHHSHDRIKRTSTIYTGRKHIDFHVITSL